MLFRSSEVYVSDNQTVSVGQPLVRLDVRPYQAAREKSEAAIRGLLEQPASLFLE